MDARLGMHPLHEAQCSKPARAECAVARNLLCQRRVPHQIPKKKDNQVEKKATLRKHLESVASGRCKKKVLHRVDAKNKECWIRSIQNRLGVSG